MKAHNRWGIFILFLASFFLNIAIYEMTQNPDSIYQSVFAILFLICLLLGSIATILD